MFAQFLIFILLMGYGNQFVIVNSFHSHNHYLNYHHYQLQHRHYHLRKLNPLLPFINFQNSLTATNMHLFHDHSHSHSHTHSDHDHPQSQHHHDTDHKSSFLADFNIFNKNFWKRPKGAVLLIATFLLIISSFTRKKLTKLDLVIFTAFTCLLSVFDTVKGSLKSWIKKVRVVGEGIRKHSTPITSNYFFKNNNLADRVTLLGVVINVLLSVSKFIGGIAFNSAVLVADAGHSLSDLFSDFITLWAVQIARIPADRDHPYGHGKFESVGSLFLSLTLLATGLSVGTWSYAKMINVLTAPKPSVFAASGTIVKNLHNTVGGLNHGIEHIVKIPSWPALLLATISIVSKEWLFHVTKQVGERLNSQILIANAWYGIRYLLSRHHRSDSFSSILSLLSIAAAIFLPGFLFVDSAAGILIAGMICLTGFEILIESMKQLTDSLDEEIIPAIANSALSVEGVNNVKNIRARRVGSGSLVDLIVLTDIKLSSSAAHSIAEKTRWKIMQSIPNILDVLVKTQASELICPLLTQNRRPITEIEESIHQVIEQYNQQNESEGNIVKSVHKITVHYTDSSHAAVEVVLNIKDHASLDAAKKYSKIIKDKILTEQKDINHVEIQMHLSQE